MPHDINFTLLDVRPTVGAYPNDPARVDRRSGETLGSFGGNGRYAGQLHWINAIATDTAGNIYTGEVEHGKRIQKFEPVLEGE